MVALGAVLALSLVASTSSYLVLNTTIAKQTSECVNVNCNLPIVNLTVYDDNTVSSYQLVSVEGEISNLAVPVSHSNVKVKFDTTSYDRRYKQLLRSCGTTITSNVTDSEVTVPVAKCYTVTANVVHRPDWEHLWNSKLWWVLLPTVVSLVGLLLALLGCWIQKRKVKSFKVLFEEHLIQTASSQA
ncbi:unnamed protein product [Bursaphelenchus okinawaensis]|uniref:Uncharacterized protein n=1 Tax=Bursaphelenchus okinawaensis TaxID=465554 RepID=A0A811JSZ2_9BILA|nr:unnamed protein product [Bursaphelenchus okinawaensis]CAG9081564.1 unnamed protein product [Bursaphelenchus okinawaensis]